MVFVIVHDNIDYYWALSRVLERMNMAQGRLPEGVEPALGPDATATGQIFWYTVEGEGVRPGGTPLASVGTSATSLMRSRSLEVASSAATSSNTRSTWTR